MPATWSLLGARAVVTGGTKGIGAAVVQEFLLLGAQVLIVSRHAEELASAVEVLNAALPAADPAAGVDLASAGKSGGPRAFGCAADVSTVEGRAALVAYALGLWGGAIDVLVLHLSPPRET